MATSTGIVWVMSFSRSCANDLCLLREPHAPSKEFLFNLTYPNRVSANFPLYLTNFVCPFALFCQASIVLFARRRAFPERSFQNRFFCAVFGRFFVRTKDKKRLHEYEVLLPQNSLAGSLSWPFLEAEGDSQEKCVLAVLTLDKETIR